MKKFLFIFQILLKLLLVFLIAFVWLRFFLDSVWVSLALSLGITIAFEILHTTLKRKSKTRESLKIKEKETAENMFLSLSTQNSCIDFFEEMLKTRHNNIEKKKKYIIIKKEEKKTILYPYVYLSPIKPENIIEILKDTKKENLDKITIICYDYDKDTLAFLKNFKEEIILLDRFESYSLFKEYEFYPKITQKYKKDAKLTFKDLLSFAFNRSRTKGYLFSAIILFITSFFVPINLYYCIICSLLLLFALISYINPKYNKKQVKEVI